MDTAQIISGITSIATIALAVITWRHVLLTRDMLKASNTPEVVMFLVLRRNVELLLRVENMGTGYASDINFTGDLSFEIPGRGPLGEVEPFKNGINYLGSGYRVDTFLFTVDDVDTVRKHIFDITVSYKDSVNGEHESRPFRFGDWDDVSTFTNVETVDDEIVGCLESVWEALDDIRNKIAPNNTVDDDTISSE